MSVALPRGRSVAILLAALVVVATGAVAVPAARAADPTWSYSEGLPDGTPFSFAQPLDPQLTLVRGTDESLRFQVTEAPADQVRVVTQTSPIDLPMPVGSNPKKDVLSIGGHLELNGVRDVNVHLLCNIDSHRVGGQLQWSEAGNVNPGPQDDFAIQFPAYVGGTTFAYQVIFTAPAGMVMASPIVLDDITIVYGPYHKRPKQKGDGGGTGDNKGKTGGDKGKSTGSNTGRGTGSGAGAGSGSGSGSGPGGSGSGGSSGGAAQQGIAATSASAATTAVKSTTTHSATATTDAPVSTQQATSSISTTPVVQGYALVAPSVLKAAGSGSAAALAAAEGGAAALGGGHSVGGGSGLGHWGAYAACGAIVVGLLLLPVPFVARRRKRVASYEHETVAADGWHRDAVR